MRTVTLIILLVPIVRSQARDAIDKVVNKLPERAHDALHSYRATLDSTVVGKQGLEVAPSRTISHWRTLPLRPVTRNFPQFSGATSCHSQAPRIRHSMKFPVIHALGRPLPNQSKPNQAVIHASTKASPPPLAVQDGVTVRAGLPEDIPHLTDLQKQAKMDIDESSKETQFLVAEADSRVVACMRVRMPECWDPFEGVSMFAQTIEQDKYKKAGRSPPTYRAFFGMPTVLPEFNTKGIESLLVTGGEKLFEQAMEMIRETVKLQGMEMFGMELATDNDVLRIMAPATGETKDLFEKLGYQRLTDSELCKDMLVGSAEQASDDPVVVSFDSMYNENSRSANPGGGWSSSGGSSKIGKNWQSDDWRY